MADAETITFTPANAHGVGTTFDCRTKVGPLTTNDKMTVTEWVDETSLGVDHTGIVDGRPACSTSPRRVPKPPN